MFNIKWIMFFSCEELIPIIFSSLIFFYELREKNVDTYIHSHILILITAYTKQIWNIFL